MLRISDMKDWEIIRRRVILPKPEGKVGNLIFLPYLDSDQCLNAIKNTTLLSRLTYWRLYYKEYRYILRLYNKTVRDINLKSRNDIIESIREKNRSLKGIRNLTLAKGRNCYVDLSKYMELFFRFHKKSWKILLANFFAMLQMVLQKEEFKEGFDKRILLLNMAEWQIDKKDVTQKYNLLNNPCTILYLALKKSPELVQSLGDIEIIITDGRKALFKFNPKVVDKYSYLDFKLAIMKIKSDSIDKDLDNDNHLNEYGAISSNAPEEELKAAKNEISILGKLDVQDKNIAASLLDDISALVNKNPNAADDIDEPEEEEEEKPEATSDEEPEAFGDMEEIPEPPEEEEEYEEEMPSLEKEFTKKFAAATPSAKNVQEFLTEKVPDQIESPRERELRERQKQIKIAEDKTLADILDEEKNNPSLKDLPKTDINDKVNILNKKLGQSTFQNFEEQYNKEVFDHDFLNVFNQQ